MQEIQSISKNKRDKLKNLKNLANNVKNIQIIPQPKVEKSESQLNQSSFDLNQKDNSHIHSEKLEDRVLNENSDSSYENEREEKHLKNHLHAISLENYKPEQEKPSEKENVASPLIKKIDENILIKNEQEKSSIKEQNLKKEVERKNTEQNKIEKKTSNEDFLNKKLEILEEKFRETEIILNLKQQMEILEQEKNQLKINLSGKDMEIQNLKNELLIKTHQGQNEEFNAIIESLSQKNEKIIQENEELKKQLEEIKKNFQKKFKNSLEQILTNQTNKINNFEATILQKNKDIENLQEKLQNQEEEQRLINIIQRTSIDNFEQYNKIIQNLEKQNEFLEKEDYQQNFNPCEVENLMEIQIQPFENQILNKEEQINVNIELIEQFEKNKETKEQEIIKPPIIPQDLFSPQNQSPKKTLEKSKTERKFSGNQFDKQNSKKNRHSVQKDLEKILPQENKNENQIQVENQETINYEEMFNNFNEENNIQSEAMSCNYMDQNEDLQSLKNKEIEKMEGERLKYEIQPPCKNIFFLHKSGTQEKIFNKEDIQVNCTKHNDQNLEKICTAQNCKNRFLCIDCLIEDNAHLNNHKAHIKPLNDFLSELLKNLARFDQNKNDEKEKMNEQFIDFIQNKEKIEKTYEDLNQNQFGEISVFFDKMKGELDGTLNEQIKKFDQLFKNQTQNFKNNSNLMKNVLNQTYKLDHTLTQDKAFEELIQIKESTLLQQKIRDYLEYLQPRNKLHTLSIFEVIHQLLSQNLQNPIKFQNDDFIKNKNIQLKNFFEKTINEITEYILEQSESQKVPLINEDLFEGFEQNLSFDSLSCLIRFNKERGCKLKHILDLKSINLREFTCVLNVFNRFLAFGTKEGFIEIYRLVDQKLVCVLGKHVDSINFISNFIFFNKEKEKYERFLVTSGMGDRKLILWDLEKQSVFLELREHEAIVSSIVDILDGTHMVSASIDGTLIVWDIEQKKSCQIWKENSDIQIHQSFYNPVTLALLQSKDKLVYVDMKGNVIIFLLNFQENLILKVQNNIQLYKAISHIFPSKIQKQNFLIRTSDKEILVLDSNTLEVINKNQIKSIGDLVLLENKNSLFKQEFLITNTNSIEDSVSQQYLEEAQQVYIKDFYFSGISTRNRVQLLETNSGNIQLVILKRDLSSAIYAIEN